MNAELEKWMAEHSYRCDKHGTKDFAYIEDLRALFDGKVLVPVKPTEAVAYESRTKYSFGWGEWKLCSKEAYQEFSAPDARDGRYPVEVRQLFASPQSEVHESVTDRAWADANVQVPPEVKGRVMSEMFWRGVYACQQAMLAASQEQGK